MDAVAIIPARWASSRFPGKMLAPLGDAPVISHVVKAATKALSRVIVATDDCRIADAVSHLDCEVVLTSPDCPDGTSRCLEAFRKLDLGSDVIVNVQGDEPFADPAQIRSLADVVARNPLSAATFIRELNQDESHLIFDPNSVKVVIDNDLRAMYFSRSPIPAVRGVEPDRWMEFARFFVHVGMYAYSPQLLQRIVSYPKSADALAENLEQLTWLQNGVTIQCCLTSHVSLGIDTPEDLQRANLLYIEQTPKTTENEQS